MFTPDNLPPSPLVTEPVPRSGISPFAFAGGDMAQRLLVGFVVCFERIKSDG